jgi:hypothetical protein
MPRRHRAARERSTALAREVRPVGGAPKWAGVEGVTVRAVGGEPGRRYRCPGCEQEFSSTVPHLVVVIEGDVETRRHWHSNCWRQELRRRGYAV